MRASKPPPGAEVSSSAPPVVSATKTMVAVVVTWNGKIALFKRSRQLADQGLWHCITGYVEPGISPKQQALSELLGETGVHTSTLVDFHVGPILLVDDHAEKPLIVHTFLAASAHRRLKNVWENDSYRWTAPGKVKRFANRVSWLDRVLTATIPRC